VVHVNLPVLNLTQLLWSNAKPRRQVALGSGVRGKLAPDDRYKWRVKFSRRLAFEPGGKRMAFVFGTGAPLKIVHSIILWIAILVVYLRLSVWIWNKRFSDHAVNGFPFTPNRGVNPSRSTRERLQNLGFWTRLKHHPVLEKEGADATKIAHLVKSFLPNYRHPNLVIHCGMETKIRPISKMFLAVGSS
jgi:hypothetical protein